MTGREYRNALIHWRGQSSGSKHQVDMIPKRMPGTSFCNRNMINSAPQILMHVPLSRSVILISCGGLIGVMLFN